MCTKKIFHLCFDILAKMVSSFDLFEIIAQDLLRHGCHERRTRVELLYILLISLAGILLGFIVRDI